MKLPFFIIALNMLIGDMLNLVFVLIFVAIPTTFAGRALYSDMVLMYFVSVDTLNYHSNLWFSLLMTCNRLCVFVLRPLNEVFAGKYLNL